MGCQDVRDFLKSRPFDWFKIREISFEVGISERNVRKHVIRLEIDGDIKGRCRGDYINWNREFQIKESLESKSENENY